METNNAPRPPSSCYSFDGVPDFNNIPMRNLGANRENSASNIAANVDWTLFREKQRQDRKSRITIMILTGMVALLGILAAVLGTLYGIEKSQPPRVEMKTTTSTMTLTSSVLPVTISTTTSLPPLTETTTQTTTFLQTTTTPMTSFVTETLPPVTQTTTQNLIEISLVTTIVTTTLVFTITETTALLISTTKGLQAGQRCTVNYEYGGEDLHNLNSDYDLLMVDALQRAIGKGLDLGTDDYQGVALKSIFECAVTDVLDLVEACKSGYVHDTGGIYCIS